jgi:hypothetical protein
MQLYGSVGDPHGQLLRLRQHRGTASRGAAMQLRFWQAGRHAGCSGADHCCGCCTSQGVFTQDFCMNEPGNATITINNYQNRGLRTNQTTSKVHRELDVDF